MTDETTTTAAPEIPVDSQTEPADPAASESEIPTVEEAPLTESPTSEAPEGESSEGESGFTDDPSSKSVDEETGVEDDDTADVEDEEGDEDEESVHGEDEEPKKPRKKKHKKKTKSSDETEDAEDKKKPGEPKGVLEYDLSDMYPQVSVLVGKPRREWNFHDPEVIRALWLDSRTNAVTNWKVRFGYVNRAKQTQVEIPLNHTAQLRLEFQKQKEEQRKINFNKTQEMLVSSRKTPHFNTVQMATTTTVEMRYKFTRNNPPVPAYYINHYDKYKKPPFKTKVGRPCKLE